MLACRASLDRLRHRDPHQNPITAALLEVRENELLLRRVEPAGSLYSHGQVGGVLLHDLPAANAWRLLEDVAEGDRRQLDAVGKTNTVALAAGDSLECGPRLSARARPLPGYRPVTHPVAQEGKYPGVEVRDDHIAFDPRGQAWPSSSTSIRERLSAT